MEGSVFRIRNTDFWSPNPWIRFRIRFDGSTILNFLFSKNESAAGFSSFLSVDKRLFGRLQDELTAAQSELKLKEEEVKFFLIYLFII
jgi:hypothetical protein